ncbi:hypothetical protein L3X38_034782 [Prunus dulcis]|uniref:Transposable element protein n=1 Tax=Prunus dulcis TaxID=3755 RepID=A0AAD4VJV0_PRUDU|nr:hypothetical protein L3X38_034782 [Prunus dulcis]
MYTTSLLSRFMQNRSQIHYGAAKRILRYLQGTIDYGIQYKPTTDPRLFGYTTVIGLDQRIFEDMGECQTKATEILCDNKSAIATAKNPVFHSRTKHIVIKHHFSKERS